MLIKMSTMAHTFVRSYNRVTQHFFCLILSTCQRVQEPQHQVD